jgi:Ty3 transposon capsid-like protein
MSTPTSQLQQAITPKHLLAHQQLVINNLSSRLAAMEESASVPSLTAQHSAYRYKAANPTPFACAPDTLKNWILQVDTHLQLASVQDPASQFLVATQFLAVGSLSWVQTTPGLATWTEFKAQMTQYYQPLHEKLPARDALHVLRQRGTVDDYSKAYNGLVIKVPQMTLEEKLYTFIKGLKYNAQVSVSLQSPSTVEQAKLVAASADGILSNQRYYGGGPTRTVVDPPPWKSEQWGSARTDWTRRSMGAAERLDSSLSMARKATGLTRMGPKGTPGRETSPAVSGY